MLKIALLLATLTGCASVTIPPENLQRSEASIRGAEEVGALSVPAAKLHLQLAKDQTESAMKMAKNGDERAILVLARAEADAELALVLAREAQVQREAAAAAEALKNLRAQPTP